MGVVLLILVLAVFCLYRMRDLRYSMAGSLVLLAGLVLFALGFARSPPPSLIFAVNLDKKVGVEWIVGRSSRAVLSLASAALARILPDRMVMDEVPQRFLTQESTLTAEMWRSHQAAPFAGVYDQLLGGAISGVQSMTGGAFFGLFGLLLAMLLIVLAWDIWRPTVRSLGLSLAIVCAVSVLSSLRLSEGWDEMFINLRHAYMLVHHGMYSVNAGEMLEATVAFLPLMITALMGWAGMALPDAYLLTSLAGCILVPVYSYLIASAVTRNRYWSLLTALVLALSPNVIWVGATGFAAPLFSGCLLAATYYLLFTPHRVLALVLLALLTLVRIEGVLFAALLMAYSHVLAPLARRENPVMLMKTALVQGLAVASPFLLSLPVRYLVYGHAVPNPVAFKNSGGDMHYAQTGISNLYQMITAHDVHLLGLVLALLVCVYFLIPRKNVAAPRPAVVNLLVLCVTTGLFILPYYSGGGDWFPVAWNRYGQPFVLSVTLGLLCMTAVVVQGLLSSRQAAMTLPVLVLVFAVGFSQSRATGSSVYWLTALELLNPVQTGWQRVDQLARTGRLFDEILPVSAIVSSPEEATMMYFSGHDMLGLLGISSPAIAAMPLQPMAPGDLQHRKRAHEVLYTRRPEIIALYEPFVTGDFSNREARASLVATVLNERMFTRRLVDIAYARVGSYDGLEAMGYRYFAVMFDDVLFGFFVHESIAGHVRGRLSQLGSEPLMSIEIDYRVDPRLTGRYVPAVAEIMEKL